MVLSHLGEQVCLRSPQTLKHRPSSSVYSSISPKGWPCLKITFISVELGTGALAKVSCFSRGLILSSLCRFVLRDEVSPSVGLELSWEFGFLFWWISKILFLLWEKKEATDPQRKSRWPEKCHFSSGSLWAQEHFSVRPTCSLGGQKRQSALRCRLNIFCY